MKTKCITVLVTLVAGANVFAQGDAKSLGTALSKATSELSPIVNNVALFLNVIAAFVGFFGIFRVYSKYQNGDQDTNKAIAQFGGAFIFLIAASYIIKSFFGIS